MAITTIPEIGEHAKDVGEHDILHGTPKLADFFGHTDPAAAADQIHDELADAARHTQYQGRPDSGEVYAGANYDDPRSQLEKTLFGRLLYASERTECGALCGALFLLAAIDTAGMLIWWFTAGPGRQRNPTPKDDTSDNVPRGPGAVLVDVILNDEDYQGALVKLAGANAQGLLVQPKTGTWSVTAGNQVQFIPDPACDFNQPVAAAYVLSLNGTDSPPAKVMIQYQASTPPARPDPSAQWKRATYSTSVTFDVGNASGNVVLVKPDAKSPSTQTVKNGGVWTVVNSRTVTFKPDAKFDGFEATTDIQLDFGSARSKPATLTSVFLQPLAAPLVVQDLTIRKPSPAIDVVIRSAAIAPHSLDRSSVKLVGVRDMDLGGIPDSVVISNDKKKMVSRGQGVWMVSADGHIAFAPDLLGPNLVNAFEAGKDRNDYTGFVGMKFTSAVDRTAARLGIRKPTGATGNWAVTLTDDQGKALASVNIDLTGGAAGEVSYGACSVQLVRKADYYLVTQVTQGGQLWPDSGSVSLLSTVGIKAQSVCATSLTGLASATGGEADTSFVGLDLTLDGFTGSPVPALYTVSDTAGNSSAPAMIVLNYGVPVQPVAINDPDDTSFFTNLRQWVTDHNPPLPHARQLAILTVAANATKAMVDSAGPSPITGVDARYTTFKNDANGAGSSPLLWSLCSDITTASVDPNGRHSPMYARYWRLRTMQELVFRLVQDLNLK